jgi:hypothetical protein
VKRLVNSNGKSSGGSLHSPPGLLLYIPAARKKKNNTMHKNNIEQEHNLYDHEHPEWFTYDTELLNAWYWEQFIKEIQEEQ